MQDKVGALVAINPNDGEILAMISRPAFDPNSFIGHMSTEDWQELVNDPASPFMNRVIQGAYSPGSIFKIIIAYAGLEMGAVHREDWIFCNGEMEMYDRVFSCSHRGGHGFVNVNLAIQNSCNIFFYRLGMEMGIDAIANYARKLGLGGKTGIDLPGERTGVVPDPLWKLKKYGRRWYGGETVSVAIGQGALAATPIQLVKAISEVATDAGPIHPHLRLGERPAQTLLTSLTSQNARSYDPGRREILRDAMWRVVNSAGTGVLAAVAGMDVCGKTGTVQVISKEKRTELGLSQGGAASGNTLFNDHAWFVGFAPKNMPEIAIAVFVEHGGGGGTTAAPIAAEVFREYFSKKGLIPRTDTHVASLPQSPVITP
jgi:penicillin-binding protein 2